MKKKSKYGRNPKLNPKTHCVMVRFDDEEWNKFLTMYEESEVYAKAVFLKAHFFGQKFKVLTTTSDRLKTRGYIIALSTEFVTFSIYQIIN